jgi:hypothetical protein
MNVYPWLMRLRKAVDETAAATSAEQHPVEGCARRVDNAFYLRDCSSRGGTRTHNPRIKSLGRRCRSELLDPF